MTNALSGDWRIKMEYEFQLEHKKDKDITVTVNVKSESLYNAMEKLDTFHYKIVSIRYGDVVIK